MVETLTIGYIDPELSAVLDDEARAVAEAFLVL